jgi:Family of unknown function (DUF5709)
VAVDEPDEAGVADLVDQRLRQGEPDELAEDVGIDGGAVSAEEAAVHVVEPSRLDQSEAPRFS